MQRAIRTALLTAIRNLYLYYYSSPTSRDVASSGSWLIRTILRRGLNIRRVEVRMERLALELGERARCVLQSLTLDLWRQGCESCSVFDITSGSPLCRGLTRATYILCIEHPRRRRD